jgi:hypothetical protein
MSVTIVQVEQLISQGRYLEARNLAEEGLTSYDNSLRFKQLYALALSKSGVPQAAADFFAPVYEQNQSDPESSGILGGIYKELFKQNQDSKFAILSRDTYAKNFDQTKNHYTGINAATMSAIAGKMQKGREIASEVIALLKEDTQDYWEIATLAEANLLVKNRAKAIDLYFKAKQIAGTDWGKINSVYNQLWLMNHYVPVPSEVIKVFGPPEVVAFVGHMIDHPSRTKPRFPDSIENEIKNEIAYALKSTNARIGYSSLACGADILFAEAMLDLGGEVNLFLPFDKDDFIATSVQFAGNNWIERFENILNNRNINYLTTEKYEGNDGLFALQSKVIFGASILRSQLLHAKVNLLTVLSEVDLKSLTGGTRDTVNLWPIKDRIHNINPDKYVSEIAFEITTKPEEPQSSRLVKNKNAYVSYLCQISFLDKTNEEIEKIWQETSVDMLDTNLTVNAYCIESNSLLISFNVTHACIDYPRALLAKYHIQEIKVSIHAGPVVINNIAANKAAHMHSKTVDIVKEINVLAIPGTIVTTATFAAVLALNPELYDLNHSGMADIMNGEKIEIYQIRKLS